MSAAQVEIQILAVVVAVACALPGVFLVLRRLALMADAIGHAMLFGIVIAFFVTHDIASPLLILAAALTGLLTVSLVELLTKTRLVKEDAAIGLVFPALFAAAVVLISRYAGDVHLDTDAVLLGEIAFAPLRRTTVLGLDLPKALVVMSIILLANVAFLSLFYKEMKVATFDPLLASALGFAPTVLHYAFMLLVSTTAVGAFDSVGAVLVVAMMIAPPATARLLTDRLSRLLLLSALFGAVSAVSGYWLAYALDASIAGAMATMSGVCFVASFLWAPQNGFVSGLRRRARQRVRFAEKMLAVHLYHHESLPEAPEECSTGHLSDHLQWTPEFAKQTVSHSRRDGIITVETDGRLHLTDEGRRFAQDMLVR